MEDLGLLEAEERPSATRETHDLWRFFVTRVDTRFGRTRSVEIDPPYRTGYGIALFGVVFGFWWGRAKDDDAGLAHSVGLGDYDPETWEIGEW